MDIFAAVMTGKGTGAIATIQVFGEKAESLLKKIFKPAGERSLQFKTGAILVGTIINSSETIDQVTIGCEGENHFAINCHGNPLIVEDIMNLLKRHGVRIITPEQMLYKILAKDKSLNTIAIEAKLTIPKAKTIDGTRIIVNQTSGGLSGLAKHWLSNLDKIPLDQISADAGHILKASETASLIIFGCKVVIAGPPNTGKSTLLNRLAGRDAAIVSEIKGTTRDWVRAACQIGPLALELIDTAGLDETIAVSSDDKAAQQKAAQLLKDADLVLLVLDISETTDQLTETLIEKITGKKVLIILNKNDLLARFDPAKLAPGLADIIRISAKFGTGTEQLCVEIQQLAGVENFDLLQPVCFTARQEQFLTQLSAVKSKDAAHPIITELLSGRLNV
jgi:tRNA modification GTPase